MNNIYTRKWIGRWKDNKMNMSKSNYFVENDKG